MLILKIKAKTRSEEVKELFRMVMKNGTVDAIFARIHKTDSCFPPSLIKDENIASEAGLIIPPLMNDNSASILSSILRKSSSDKKPKIAAFMRPCEARAFIELTKLKQGSLESVLLFTPICPGTLSFEEYRKNEKISFEDLFSLELEKKRKACQICAFPYAPFSDVEILFKEQETVLVSKTEKGKSFLSSLGAKKENGELERDIEPIIKERKIKRTEFLAEMTERLNGVKNLRMFLKNCVNCHNCMRNCPVCYCRLCFFESAEVEPDVHQYLALAHRDGYRSLDSDKLFFHLGRLEHISTLCVNCGVCSDACPNGVEIFGMFALVSESVQKMFEYVPGASPETPLPMTVYRENELEHLGK